MVGSGLEGALVRSRLLRYIDETWVVVRQTIASAGTLRKSRPDRKRRTPVTGFPLSHVGFIVEDLDAAIARFSEVLGITFNDPQTVHLNHIHDPVERQGMLKVAFSVEGPPHYELIQGDGQGIYTMAGGGEGMHHIGLWETDLEKRLPELAKKGFKMEARVHLDNGFLLTSFNDPADLHGVRVEFVDDVDRPIMERFMKTGSFDEPYAKFENPNPGELRM
jgi:catechol 2,3-dioxygenase-like lactoylglutathione lyase family enzyme